MNSRVAILGPFLAVIVVIVVTGSVSLRAQQRLRAEDTELAAALSKKDVATVTRLTGIALKEPLPVPASHPAASVLGPSAAASLSALLNASGDMGAAARINNLAVALALRGWTQSAAVAFGGAMIVAEPIYRGRPWPSVLDPNMKPSGVVMRQSFSTRPNPAVANIPNLERLAGTEPRQRSAPRFEFALGLLETASAWPTAEERLRAMAEVFPPVVSVAIAEAMASPDAPELFERRYSGFAQYKGTFLRGLRSRRSLVPAGAANPNAPEVWDDRGVYGFNPTHRLRPGEALVDIYLVELGQPGVDLRSEYVAVVGSVPVREGARLLNPLRVISLGNAGAIDEAIDRFWDDLIAGQGEMTPTALGSLADRIWRPLEKVLPAGTSRVWLAPDGRLTQVPWQAMSLAASPKSPATISVVDSGETIRESRRTVAPSTRMLLAANPEYGAGANPRFVPLPKSAEEIAEIARIARAHGLEPAVLEGEAVTEPSILRQLPARIVHLATHGEFHPAKFRPDSLSVGPWLVFDVELRKDGAPDAGAAAVTQLQDAMARAMGRGNSAGQQRFASVAQGVLALSGANAVEDPFVHGSPAFLTDVDLGSLDLAATELVVLSACDLGQAEQSAFQGLGSMQAAVVTAGARALLASLWKVPDDETAAFMAQFYERLLVQKLPAAEALRETQRAVSVDEKGRPRSPFLWAGWMLFGEGW